MTILPMRIDISLGESRQEYDLEVEQSTTELSADHTIVVSSSSGGPVLYLKVNGSWTAVSAVYKKVNGSWVQQSNLSTLFSTSANYVKGN